ELLDRDGAPRVRVAPPYVVDARGTRHEARLSVEGCRYDAGSGQPWGRPVTAPGAHDCILHVSWPPDLPHPLVVDPAWQLAKGKMSTPRTVRSSTALQNGRVLVAGGLADFTNGPLATAEIYDPVTDTFAATSGPPKGARSGQSATLLSDGRVLLVAG